MRTEASGRVSSPGKVSSEVYLPDLLVKIREMLEIAQDHFSDHDLISLEIETTLQAIDDWSLAFLKGS
jgi:hypothetical protein